jgi:hypothetical protein
MNRETIIRLMRRKARQLGYMLIIPKAGTKLFFLVEGEKLVHADRFDAMKEFLQV